LFFKADLEMEVVVRMSPVILSCPYRSHSLHILLIIFVGMGCVEKCRAQTDRRIEQIKQRYEQVNAQIAESETSDGSELYLNELIVNKNGRSWPAVGTYEIVYKFYYGFGDREKDPYPNTLVKVTVSTSRSGDRVYAEYLFNPAGQVIFYYEKDRLQIEHRHYYQSEKLIRLTREQQAIAINSRKALLATKAAFTDKKRLLSLFTESLTN
jgi:hypothetical protein